MLTSWHFEYMYKNSFSVFPFGPFPFVDTFGIWAKGFGFLTGIRFGFRIEMVCVTACTKCHLLSIDKGNLRLIDA